MKRDARLREGLVGALSVVYARGTPAAQKLAGEILDRWDELVDKEQKLNEAEQSNATVTKAWYAARDERDRLRALLTEHHAVGALDGVLIGDECPICKPVDEEGRS